MQTTNGTQPRQMKRNEMWKSESNETLATWLIGVARADVVVALAINFRFSSLESSANTLYGRTRDSDRKTNTHTYTHSLRFWVYAYAKGEIKLLKKFRSLTHYRPLPPAVSFPLLLHMCAVCGSSLSSPCVCVCV